ncbi:MAG: Hsp20/alpha crystallin family protein [Verrucomicrobiae bacterium]|nr:Hsp20/alpha crystallin family protein [Verrucomicrobiae bacterium]
MSLVRWTRRSDLWDPFAGLADLQEEMNRLFDLSLRRLGRTSWEGAFVPMIDVIEQKDHYLVKAELPGLSKDDVNVTLQDNLLTIKGEKKHEAETQDANFYRRERLYGAFCRTIELPATVDAKKIEAHFKDGVLTVKLPKTEEAKPRQIEVKVG